MLKSYLWVATNPAYYEAHRHEVDSAWNWIGTDGNKQLNLLLRKYTEH